MVRAVLVDLYGTLVHDDGDAVERACGDVAALAPGVRADALRAAWDARLWDLAEPAHGPAFRGLFDPTAAALTDVLDGWGHGGIDVAGPLTRLREEWRTPRLHPDARGFLGAVRAAGLPVAVVSDADAADARSALERHGLVPDVVVTSEDARAYKPRPEPFEAALRALGVGPADAVHVGDSLVCDVGGPGALGIVAVHLTRDGGTGAPDLGAAAAALGLR